MDTSVQDEILRFWFGSLELDTDEMEQRISLWFEAGPDVDAEIATRFGNALSCARRGELNEWQTTARGRLALIVLLDQFSRNLHRGTPEAFSSDAEALHLCLEGIERRHDTELSIVERAFYYMPLQHVEDLSIQERSTQLFQTLVTDCADDIRPQMRRFLASARSHRIIIAKFGRFPHRNRVLGRACSESETDFLSIGMVPFRSKN